MEKIHLPWANIHLSTYQVLKILAPKRSSRFMYMWSVEHVQAQTWSPANFLCTKIPPESPDKASKSSCNILLYKHNFLLLIQTIRHLCFVLYYACVVASPFGCRLTWVPTMHANRPSRSLFVASCEILLVKEETNDEGIKSDIYLPTLRNFR